ncbi:uncharacterized protein MPTK1_4g04530 [Marchantia polymorpha subsp. ruderalis]|uniref:Uncharacterized protein n=2 Tax=Marchantia polymorpha TaxID=3197 RepID=A0A176WLJ5_MARPO|nr:hypothetical protein AXG93_1200s1170 [Marchantia polymorpha subsp. ruderalis]PTQ39541.1 hypothetical protein MARPO_0044s0020 [Marchantia polymorpha]BBN07559.1 hypothetical protein Mp_4g04530 [Marchantia polymorpha subsp. ruderalis]|eukprot:PTQ39541.1 hypothetical protein MARPO_0044s0020 [Marchantia polymorpha]
MSITCEPSRCAVARRSSVVVSSGCQYSLCFPRRRVFLRVPCPSDVNQFNEASSRLSLQSRFVKSRRTTTGSSCSRDDKKQGCQTIICQSAAGSFSPSTDAGRPFCWPISLAPLAALALAFSRAATFIVNLREEILQRKNTGECAEREFCEAAEKNLPWKPEMVKALARSGGISMALLSTTALAKDHLTPVIMTLRANPTFMSGLIAWALAQVMKVFTYYVVVRKWDFRMVMGSGGMPSSHSALCFALTTSVALVHGVADALFPVCLGFTLIVMYDAAGVRRHAGKQAEILNIIVADMFQGHPISERKLKELLGHTPLQVFAGAALGILVGYLCSQRV